MTTPEQRQELLELLAKAGPDAATAITRGGKWERAYLVTAANLAPGLARDVERLKKAIEAVYSLATRMLSEPPETIPPNTGELVEICTIIEIALTAGEEKPSAWKKCLECGRDLPVDAAHCEECLKDEESEALMPGGFDQ